VTAPDNLDFETAGGAVGGAASWFVASGNAAGPPVWLVAGWNRYETSGVPAADPTVPFLGPNNFKGVNGFWTEHNTNVDTDFAAGPPGTVDADRLRDNLVNIAHFIDETAGPRTFKAGVKYTFGFHFKDVGSGAPFIGPRLDLGGGTVIAIQAAATNLPAVLAMKGPAGVVQAVSGEAVDSANGWICMSMSFVLSIDTAARPGFGFSSAVNEVYAGTLNGHLIWGAFIYAEELLTAEDFEDAWSKTAAGGSYLFSLVLGVSEISAAWQDGTVTTKNTEAFEGGWNNNPYLLTMDASLTTSVIWDAGDADSNNDTFDVGEGWDGFYTNVLIEGVNATSVEWDEAGVDEDFDSFEIDPDAGWGGPYYDGSPSPSETLATFDGPVAENFEDFEEGFKDVLVTFANGTDKFTATAHGLLNDQVVRVVNVGGSFPVPFVRTLNYFVVNKTANDFQLSLTQGGAAINGTDDGTGDLYVRAAADRYWWGPDFNPTI
jgi:hypothetical protein